MQDLQVLLDGGYKGTGLTKFKLSCPLTDFPQEILELGDSLEQLDFSGTGLSSLPANLGSFLPNLKIAFFSNCNFTVFPKELATCPNLEMVAFRGNAMVEIPEDALPLRLRWLILTGNRIKALPASIGRCTRLQKCMIAGNQLRSLPAEMAQCTKLGLLRLSANQLSILPPWLFTLPELAFLSFAGNPCSTPLSNGTLTTLPLGLSNIPWPSLTVQHTLGRGASGIISQALWEQSPGAFAEEVAIKLFHGALTSDGTPADEMAACLAAGAHESLISLLGRITDHPDEENEMGSFQGGIVMQLVPEQYCVLGQPPSMASCTRDCFEEAAGAMSAGCALSMLAGVAGAAGHLHRKGIAHGDLYAHNILASREDAHALLGDFGAATVYGKAQAELPQGAMEKLEVLAFAHLVEDILGLVKEEEEGEEEQLRKGLKALQTKCAVADVEARPTFEEITQELEDMMGWRGMMRIPDVPN
ncbi:hypothetical protein B0T25DRAFT_296388 [Lasiosphaeria hispida]|uniref:Protein kinase domain-containing protein n=1 Tax=Lasiosphaeria hispida TaxID=260671 RepID=A0AAJ0HDD0_9PEZI|nr:hypothetical protein B0T25DRAFT_296388 [Lasiosphaeria hispida]